MNKKITDIEEDCLPEKQKCPYQELVEMIEEMENWKSLSQIFKDAGIEELDIEEPMKVVEESNIDKQQREIDRFYMMNVAKYGLLPDEFL